MESLKKLLSILTAFSLAVSLMTAPLAKATEFDAPVGMEDSELGAETGEEEDVLTTVSDDGATTEDPSGDDGATMVIQSPDDGVTSGDEETTETPSGEEEPEAGNDTGTTSGEEEPEAGNDTGTASGEEEPEAGNDTGTTSGEEEPEAGNDTETPSGEEEPEAPVLPFTDVPAEHWSYPYVLYAYQNDLVRGVSATAFNPTGVMTRAAFVTVLYRLAAKLDGADMAAPEATFADISDINAEFQSAVRWAAAHGIVTGRNDETFAPRDNVTRQQMCAILVRYLRDYLNYDLSAYVSDAVFADSETISAYAKEAVSIAQALGLISGRETDGVTIFDPAGSASRAAVVKVLSLAVQKMRDLMQQPVTEPEDTGDSQSGTDTGDSQTDTDTGDSKSETDTGDSKSETDTGDSQSDASGGSSGGGGSSSGGGGGSSSGGSSSGGSGSSSGGSSSGGSGSNSGGSTRPANESEETKRVFAYLNEVIENYEKNPPENVFVQYCMNIFITDLRSAIAARNAGAVVDEAYVKSHYSADMQQILDLYNSTSAENAFAMIEYAKTLTDSTSKLLTIAQYFGLTSLLLG